MTRECRPPKLQRYLTEQSLSGSRTIARLISVCHGFVGVALDEGHRDAQKLAGDQLGGGGQLVGDGDGGGVQLVAVGVELAHVAG